MFSARIPPDGRRPDAAVRRLSGPPRGRIRHLLVLRYRQPDHLPVDQSQIPESVHGVVARKVCNLSDRGGSDLLDFESNEI